MVQAAFFCVQITGIFPNFGRCGNSRLWHMLLEVFLQEFRMSRMSDTQSGGSQNLKDSAAEVAGKVRDMGSQVRDAATEKFDDLRQQANDYYEQGRERARELEQSLESYVQEKPIQSLLIAAGVGMLLGVLWKRS
jgi:ElaB/YqjD/DUF883 family membrane-anchored ribosome-binding protein